MLTTEPAEVVAAPRRCNADARQLLGAVFSGGGWSKEALG